MATRCFGLGELDTKALAAFQGPIFVFKDSAAHEPGAVATLWIKRWCLDPPGAEQDIAGDTLVPLPSPPNSGARSRPAATRKRAATRATRGQHPCGKNAERPDKSMAVVLWRGGGAAGQEETKTFPGLQKAMKALKIHNYVIRQHLADGRPLPDRILLGGWRVRSIGTKVSPASLNPAPTLAAPRTPSAGPPGEQEQAQAKERGSPRGGPAGHGEPGGGPPLIIASAEAVPARFGTAPPPGPGTGLGMPEWVDTGTGTGTGSTLARHGGVPPDAGCVCKTPSATTRLLRPSRSCAESQAHSPMHVPHGLARWARRRAPHRTLPAALNEPPRGQGRAESWNAPRSGTRRGSAGGPSPLHRRPPPRPPQPQPQRPQPPPRLQPHPPPRPAPPQPASTRRQSAMTARSRRSAPTRKPADGSRPARRAIAPAARVAPAATVAPRAPR